MINTNFTMTKTYLRSINYDSDSINIESRVSNTFGIPNFQWI